MENNISEEESFETIKSREKCLTKGTGSESLRRAIDEYWESVVKGRTDQ